MPLSGSGSKDAERSSMSGRETEEDDSEMTTIDVIRVTSASTKVSGKDSDLLRYSPDASCSATDSQSKATETKGKRNKWTKLKTGLVRGTKSIGNRLKPGAGRNQRNVVQEICILPSTSLSGECFGEEKEESGEAEEEVRRTARGGGGGVGGGRLGGGIGGRLGGGIGGIGRGRRKRRDSDDSLVFASRTDSATSSKSRTSLPSGEYSSKAVDASIVIYDADYDGQL